jgi:hypothetical protein
MAQGTTTVDFGTGSCDASVFVSAPTIGAGNLVEAWILPATTANNTVDNHWVESLYPVAGGIQAGVGFTIWVKCDELEAHGIYNVAWVWN